MSSKRVLYYNEHIGSSQYRLRIRKPRGDVREWWVYDSKTRSIRLANNKRYALSNQNGRLRRGQAIVMKYYKKDDQTVYYDRRQ